MRPLALLVLPLLLSAADLQVVKPIISQSEDGTPESASYEFTAGSIVYFSSRIANFGKSPKSQIQLAYSIQAFDPKGVPIIEPVKGEVKAEVGPQDKDWLPKVATGISIPPLAPSGAYKIVVKVDDLQAKTSVELPVPFKVRGHVVEPADTLTVRNFGFYRHEDDDIALAKPVYKPGDAVWARFDIVGFRYGDKNRIDVNYVTSVIAPSGKVLWTQPEPAGEATQSFYPQRYVGATFSISLQSTIRPGEYTIAVQAKDAVGNQVAESKHTFTIE